jgi:predicted NAD/FAD-dependent oxidoreductase
LTVAIIGAGIAGLACARALRAHGIATEVFERGRAAGGRCATRRTDHGAFDHGAQSFTAGNPSFAQWLSGLPAGSVERWQPRLADIDSRGTRPRRDSEERYVALPGMSALARVLAPEDTLRLQTRIVALERERSGWRLRDEHEASHGPYAAVAVTVAADQALPLLEPWPDFAQPARRGAHAPCWALMAAFGTPVDVPFDGAFVGDSPLEWIARDSSKPGRPHGERWVAHSSAEWAAAHLDSAPGQVAGLLVAALEAVLGRRPTYAAAHRWRYAQPAAPLGVGCLWDPALALGAGGDWCADGLIEGAFLSGSALAEVIARAAHA